MDDFERGSSNSLDEPEKSSDFIGFLNDATNEDCEENVLALDSKDSLISICKKHNKECTHYCVRDNIFVCEVCMHFTHQPALCECRTIEEEHIRCRTEIIKELESVDKLGDEFKQIIDYEEKRKANLVKTIQRRKKANIEYYEKQKKFVIDNLNERHKKYEIENQEAKNSLDTLSSELDDLEGKIDNASRTDDIQMLLNIETEIRTLFTKCDQSKSVLPQPDTYTLIENSLLQ